MFAKQEYGIQYCKTDVQAADIFTKPITHADKWLHAIRLIGIVDAVVIRASVARAY